MKGWMWHLVVVNPDRELTDLAARQGGVIRHEQAFACGLTHGQIGQRIRIGRWRRLGRFGYRVFDMDGMTDLVRAAVTVLPNAVVSHESAAEIHGLPMLPKGNAVVTVHTRTTHDFPNVTVHRCHDLMDEHIVQVMDLPVTSIPRTIVDLSPLVTVSHLAAIVGALITARRIVTDDVQRVVDQIARRGKPGIRKVRRVLEERDTGPRDGTPLERLGARVLRARGIPEPHFEYPLPWDPARRFDAAFPHARLAIEWDSRQWHELAEAFQMDRERDRQAQLHGWRIVRFTWADVTRRPDEVAKTVRHLLEMS